MGKATDSDTLATDLNTIHQRSRTQKPGINNERTNGLTQKFISHIYESGVTVFLRHLSHLYSAFHTFPFWYGFSAANAVALTPKPCPVDPRVGACGVVDLAHASMFTAGFSGDILPGSAVHLCQVSSTEPAVVLHEIRSREPIDWAAVDTEKRFRFRCLSPRRIRLWFLHRHIMGRSERRFLTKIECGILSVEVAFQGGDGNMPSAVSLSISPAGRAEGDVLTACPLPGAGLPWRMLSVSRDSFREQEPPASETEAEVMPDFKLPQRAAAAHTDHADDIVPVVSPRTSGLVPAKAGACAADNRTDGSLYFVHFVCVHVEHLHCFFRGGKQWSVHSGRRRGR